MEYLLPIVGLVIFAVFAGMFLLFLRGGGVRGPQEIGEKKIQREERPQAEKEQMEAPQEEFIDDNGPPSGRKR